METFIYGLKDPNTNEIRYVGKSNNPEKRLSRHINNAKSPNKTTHCYCWIKSLLKNNLLPELIILEKVSIEIWGEKENYWISQFNNLTNQIDGGKFCPMENPEIVEKMRNSLIGYKHNNQTKEKLSIIRQYEWDNNLRKGGWKHSQEYIDNRKIQTTNLWKNRTIEEINQIGKNISISKSKKYNQYDLNNNFIKTWNSIKEIEIFYYGHSKGHMKRQIKENGLWKGFIWKNEASDPLVNNPINN